MAEGNLKYLKAQRGHKAYATRLTNEAENYFPAAEENIVKNENAGNCDRRKNGNY